MIANSVIRITTILTAMTLVMALFVVSCGGAEEPIESSAAPATAAALAAPQQTAPADTPLPVRATNTPAPALAQPTPTQRISVQEVTARPTLPPEALQGELTTDRLIVVLDSPVLSSMLDCEVTGSGVVVYRMSAEYGGSRSLRRFIRADAGYRVEYHAGWTDLELQTAPGRSLATRLG